MLYHFAILLPTMVCLFWAIFLFYNLKENDFDKQDQNESPCSAEHRNGRMRLNKKSQNILAIGLLISSFTYLNLAYYINGIKDYTTYYILDIFDLAFFIPPVMYLYFKSITSEKRFGWKDYLWFLPPMLTGAILVGLYIIMGEDNAIQYSRDLLTYGTLLPKYSDRVYQLHYLLSVKLYDIIGLLLSIGVCIYALVSILRYHHRLKDFYSSLGDKSPKMHYGVLIWFIIASFSGISLFYLRRSFFLEHPIGSIFIFILLAAICFFLSYYGYRIKYTGRNLALDLEMADRVNGANSFPDDKSDAEEAEADNQDGKYGLLAIRFKKLIDEDKIYLQCSLRADEVATLLHSNRTYISRMINEEFDSNFSDYINEKRVNYSKELMRLNPGMRMNEIAEKSGFINSSSYSRTFKQFTGKPPRKWLQDTFYGIIS